MFNLDNLNSVRPEVLPNSNWNRGQIIESLDFFIESVVRRVDRDTIKYEIGESSTGPHLARVQAQPHGLTSVQTLLAQQHGSS